MAALPYTPAVCCGPPHAAAPPDARVLKPPSWNGRPDRASGCEEPLSFENWGFIACMGGPLKPEFWRELVSGCEAPLSFVNC
eukprot:scaffold242965_cov13-Tisochrysis_lutea.AAC.1